MLGFSCSLLEGLEKSSGAAPADLPHSFLGVMSAPLFHFSSPPGEINSLKARGDKVCNIYVLVSGCEEVI